MQTPFLQTFYTAVILRQHRSPRLQAYYQKGDNDDETLFVVAKLSTLVFSGLAVCALGLGQLLADARRSRLCGARTPPAGSTPNYAGLEKAYQREQTALSQQSNNLTKANSVVAKVQAYITDQKAKGWTLQRWKRPSARSRRNLARPSRPTTQPRAFLAATRASMEAEM